MVSRADDFDRPCRHGALLGAALARIADAAEGKSPFPVAMRMPDRCSTCAFREGTQANQSPGTLRVALDMVLLPDGEFWCHHGLDADGEVKRLCAGYVAARLAPFDFTKGQLAAVAEQLDRIDQDEVDIIRVAFDEWLASIDSDSKMTDIYEMGRAYERYRRSIPSKVG